MKTCKICKQELPDTDFYQRINGTLFSECKQCIKKKYNTFPLPPEQRAKRTDVMRNWRQKKRFSNMLEKLIYMNQNQDRNIPFAIIQTFQYDRQVFSLCLPVNEVFRIVHMYNITLFELVDGFCYLDLKKEDMVYVRKICASVFPQIVNGVDYIYDFGIKEKKELIYRNIAHFILKNYQGVISKHVYKKNRQIRKQMDKWMQRGLFFKHQGMFPFGNGEKSTGRFCKHIYTY